MPLHPMAGQPVPLSTRTNIAKLVSAYYTIQPDPQNPAHRHLAHPIVISESRVKVIAPVIDRVTQYPAGLPLIYPVGTAADNGKPHAAETENGNINIRFSQFPV